jgi:hypothetical protein
MSIAGVLLEGYCSGDLQTGLACQGTWMFVKDKQQAGHFKFEVCGFALCLPARNSVL